jgi:non-ribosomal peptide synthase protein (TIGR01720 family)
MRLDLTASAEPADQLHAVTRQLMAAPRPTASYSALRYLHPDETIRRALSTRQPPEIVFNYLGRIDSVFEHGLFSAAWEGTGPRIAAANPRRHLLELNAAVVGGRFTIEWHYSRAHHHRTTIETLASAHADAVRSLAACATPPDKARGVRVRNLTATDVAAALAEIDDSLV